ncbi:DUF6427 family protein [Polaribacter sp.]|uniref:DUF6427 family protein n=1 Tax=Polaribacter sp. TaxID=1920175 RepID=UPI003EF44595
MLANFLGKSKPIIFIILFCFFFCFFSFAVYASFFLEAFDPNNLFKSVVLLVLFIVLFFLYNFIVSKNRLTFDNLYAFYFYLLLTIFLLPTLIGYKELVLMVLHFFYLRKIYSLKSKKNVLQKVFDSGFWLGVSFVIEPFTGVFMFLLYAAIYFQRKTIISVLLAPIIGFVAPLIIYFTYCFWYDKTEFFTQLFSFNGINSSLSTLENSTIWFFVAVVGLSLVAIIAKSPKAFSVNNSFKRNWIILIINFIIAIFYVVFMAQKNSSEVLFLIFPASVIMANGLELVKSSLIKNLILITFLVAILLCQFLL